MTRICCICGEKPSEGVSFHTFPKDLQLRAKWCRVLGIVLFNTCYNYVCSRHFTKDSFDILPNGQRGIKKNSIPSENLKNIIYTTADPQDTASPSTSQVPEVNPNRAINPAPARSQSTSKVKSVNFEEIVLSEDDEDGPQPVAIVSHPRTYGRSTASKSETCVREKPTLILTEESVLPSETRNPNDSTDSGMPTEVEGTFLTMQERLAQKNEKISSTLHEMKRLKAKAESLKVLVEFLKEKIRETNRPVLMENAVDGMDPNKKKAARRYTKKIDFESIVHEKEAMKIQLGLLKDRYDELCENQGHYEEVASENMNLKMQFRLLEVENRKLKSMLGRPSRVRYNK